MSHHDTLTALERGFWTDPERAGFYRRNLAPDALLVLPVGVLDAEATVAAMETAAGWRDVEMEDLRVTDPAPACALLTYRARASREDGGTYEALVASLYASRDGAWRLVFHQQTPVGA